MEMILTVMFLIALWTGSTLIAIIALIKVSSLKNELREVQRQLIDLMGQAPLPESPRIHPNAEFQPSGHLSPVERQPANQQPGVHGHAVQVANPSEPPPPTTTQDFSPLSASLPDFAAAPHTQPMQSTGSAPNEPEKAAHDAPLEPRPQAAHSPTVPGHFKPVETHLDQQAVSPVTSTPRQPLSIPTAMPTSEPAPLAGTEHKPSSHLDSNQTAKQAEPGPSPEPQPSDPIQADSYEAANHPPKARLETWLGERGSAILGTIILGLAGLFFFKYSVERGFITPELRLILAGSLGMASFVASHFLHKRGALLLANGLIGAGTTILFATVWAAHSLYKFLSAPPAFLLMAALTLISGIAAHRRKSMFIAVLSLAGGFSSPLMISVSEPSPIGLFSYLFFLNLGVMALASRNRWPQLGFLSLIGTSAYQFLYFFRFPELFTIYEALGAVLLFAGLFMLAPFSLKSRSEDEGLRGGAQIIAFLFTIIFSNHSELTLSLVQMIGVSTLLTGASLWLSLRDKTPVFLNIAQVANAILLSTFIFSRELTSTLSWAAVGFSFTVLLISYVGYHLLAKEKPSSPRNILIGFCLFSPLLVFTPALREVTYYVPWFLAWLMLTLAAFTIAIRHQFRFPMFLAGCLMGCAFLVNGRHLPEPLLIPFLWGALIVWLFPWMLHRTFGSAATKNTLRTGLMVGGLAFQITPILIEAWEIQSFHHPGTHFVVVLLGLFIIGRGRQIFWLIPWILIAFATQMALLIGSDLATTAPGPTLLLCIGFSLLFLSFPIIKSSISRQITPWVSVGMALILWLPPSLHFSSKLLSPNWDFLTPLILCIATFAAAWITYRRQQADKQPNKHLITLIGIYVAFLLTLTLYLWVALPWLTMALAGEAVLAIILWRSWNHAGLKYLGAILMLLPFCYIWQIESFWPFWKFLTLYLSYFLAIISSIILLRNTESTRLRPWENLLAFMSPPVIHALGTLAILVSFYWLNATIHFYLVDYLPTSLTKFLPARDLALSLGWISYALSLLGLGFFLPKAILRHCGLSFLILSIFKVFLYDLSELEDLYRVGSLLALAFSLLSVSLLYRKFSKILQ